MGFTDIGKAKYIALETYRKNGEAVNTPVWVTSEGDKLYVWTVGDSWKVKRIRKNPRVRIAVSDARGNPKGEWYEAIAVVQETADAEPRQRERLAAKYGLMYRLFTWYYRLRGDQQPRVSIEIAANDHLRKGEPGNGVE